MELGGRFRFWIFLALSSLSSSLLLASVSVFLSAVLVLLLLHGNNRCDAGGSTAMVATAVAGGASSSPDRSTYRSTVPLALRTMRSVTVCRFPLMICVLDCVVTDCPPAVPKVLLELLVLVVKRDGASLLPCRRLCGCCCCCVMPSCIRPMDENMSPKGSPRPPPTMPKCWNPPIMLPPMNGIDCCCCWCCCWCC